MPVPGHGARIVPLEIVPLPVQGPKFVLGHRQKAMFSLVPVPGLVNRYSTETVLSIGFLNALMSLKYVAYTQYMFLAFIIGIKNIIVAECYFPFLALIFNCYLEQQNIQFNLHSIQYLQLGSN